MGLFRRISRSADLVKGMADRVGADFDAANAASPETEVSRYRAAVFGCSTCQAQGECQRLQDSCTHLDEAPEYCVNRDMLSEMARR